MFYWSIKLFHVFRIPLELHASFFIVPLYLASESWKTSQWTGVYWSMLTCSMVFACVVLHELGHALAARRFGIETERILLLPFGGVAQLRRLPQTATRELLVTLAGPAVNFTIAALLLPLMTRAPFYGGIPNNARALLDYAVYFNAIMGTFNLIPVFPMDGGRLLRASLSYKLGFNKATRITAQLGTFLAVAIGSYSFLVYKNYHLAALFAFIAFASRKELKATYRES